MSHYYVIRLSGLLVVKKLPTRDWAFTQNKLLERYWNLLLRDAKGPFGRGFKN